VRYMAVGYSFFPKPMGTCSFVRIMAVGTDYRLPITDYVKQTSDCRFPIATKFRLPLTVEANKRRFADYQQFLYTITYDGL
jgi:hypothetical protein